MAVTFVASIACFLTAWTCAEKALGVDEQFMFSPSFIWLWWICAIGYAFAGIAIWGDQPSGKEEDRRG